MKVTIKTILAVTAILALTSCGSDDSETPKNPSETNRTIPPETNTTKPPEIKNVDNTIADEDGSIAKTLTRDLIVGTTGLENLQGNTETTKLTRNSPDSPDEIRTYLKLLESKTGAFVYIRMSASDPIGPALSEDLKKGELVKIVIQAKSNRANNLIQSLSRYGGLGIPARYFKEKPDGKFETFTILFKVPQTYTPKNSFIFRLDGKSDFVTIKSIHVYVKEEA